jgi:2,3-bisphosphoglycerate-independent phosphoglycerate mutase
MTKTKRPVVLTILDGWGHTRSRHGNAIETANTPTFDFIRDNYKQLLLQASGQSVGLTWGEPGNSEVGHLTIGGGRIIFQYALRIDQAISDRSFFENSTIINAIDHANKNKSTLHLVGLLGYGTVHSSYKHLEALISMAKTKGVESLNLHLFSDGKDSGLKDSPMLVKKTEEVLSDASLGIISSIMGRWYAMDRDNNWERTQKAYDLLVNDQGHRTDNLIETIKAYYEKDSDDMHIPPIVSDKSSPIKDNDSVIFFNFREDSMRQIAQTFIDPKFDKFAHKKFENLFVALMTQYLEIKDSNLNIAFPLPKIDKGLAQVLSESGLKQLHLAETEKYAHTTYFFNCLRSTPFEGEADVLIESPKNFLENPHMRSKEIAEKFSQEIEKDIYDFFIINLANADVVSHLGILEKAAAAVESVDSALRSIYEATTKANGFLVLTSDHGNAESLIYSRTGDPETKHNPNPVPFFIVSEEYKKSPDTKTTDEKPAGLLSDVAPTILELLDIERPKEMSGMSLTKLLS